MKIIEPSFEIINPWGSWEEAFRHIERVARICYRSEEKIGPDTYKTMIRNLIRRGHGAMLEHAGFTVIFRTDRGITHEIVRHRIASFAQESTRYCNYGDKDIEVIAPLNLNADQYEAWYRGTEAGIISYRAMLEFGCQPQQARDVLPTCVASTIAVTANMREWMQVIFPLRNVPTAHPKMQMLMHGLLVHLCNNGAELMFGHLLTK